jgi:hypothetical protein
VRSGLFVADESADLLLPPECFLEGGFPWPRMPAIGHGSDKQIAVIEQVVRTSRASVSAGSASAAVVG